MMTEHRRAAQEAMDRDWDSHDWWCKLWHAKPAVLPGKPAGSAVDGLEPRFSHAGQLRYPTLVFSQAGVKPAERCRLQSPERPAGQTERGRGQRYPTRPGRPAR